MGLMQRVKSAQRRRRLMAWFVAKDGARALAEIIRKDADGGLLVHVAIERSTS